jgi:nucleoside-diphosphate-sugar epimerase
MVSGIFSRKILITGASGFIGSNLARHFVSLGCRVHVALRKDSDLWRLKGLLKKIKPHYLDLTDKRIVQKMVSRIKPEIICHCASYGGRPFQRDSALIARVNIAGTINLLEACAIHGFTCFINSGTSSEYGIKKAPMRESDPLKPFSDYGRAKSSATLFCQAMAEKEKLPVVTLRLFSPYGYFEDKSRLVAYTIVSCLRKTNPELSSPDSVRDFVFIEDVIAAYIQAARSHNKISGQILNIAAGRQYKISEVVGRIIKLSGSGVRPLWNKVLNSRIEPDFWQADINKASRMINWYPQHSLEQGLERTIRWFSKHKRLYESI